MNHTIWLIQYACWVTDVYTDFTSHSQNICHICHICHLWNIIIVGIKTEIRNYELFWPDNPDNGYWGNPDGPLEQGKGTNKYLETYHTNCFFVLDGNTATGQINTIFFYESEYRYGTSEFSMNETITWDSWGTLKDSFKFYELRHSSVFWGWERSNEHRTVFYLIQSGITSETGPGSYPEFLAFRPKVVNFDKVLYCLQSHASQEDIQFPMLLFISFWDS